jgi:hypothetical protein
VEVAKVGYLFPRSYGAWRKGSTAVNVVASSPTRVRAPRGSAFAFFFKKKISYPGFF